MSFNLNANIDFNKTGDPLERCDHTGVTVKYDIEISCLPCIIQNSVWPRFKFGYWSPVFWKIYSFSVNMVQRRISDSQRWQIIGMWSTQISFKAIGRQMGYHYTVVSWLVRKHTQTNTRKDLPISGRPHVTSQHEERALHRLFRRMPFETSLFLIRQWLPSRRVSARTVGNRLQSAGRKPRRVIKRSMLSDRYQRLRLAWYLVWRSLNLRTWRRIHMSDESWFLVHTTDGPMRVWRQKNTAYTPRNIQPTVPYDGCSVMIWVVFLMIAS